MSLHRQRACLHVQLSCLLRCEKQVVLWALQRIEEFPGLAELFPPPSMTRVFAVIFSAMPLRVNFLISAINRSGVATPCRHMESFEPPGNQGILGAHLRDALVESLGILFQEGGQIGIESGQEIGVRRAPVIHAGVGNEEL